MKHPIHLALLCFVFLHAAAHAQSTNQQTVFKIDAILNTKTNVIEGNLDLIYVNNSQDTLPFIWFKLVPNAFKNDRTAFSEYLLENDRTDFYFAENAKRGYINQLDFKNGNVSLRTEDHPLYIDVLKVLLDKPLLPARSIKLSTPFHVKIPYNFDGIGYDKSGYKLRYWYPVPALYSAEPNDTSKRWHDSPFTSGETKVESGTYDLKLKVPSSLKVYTNSRLVDSVTNNNITTLNYSSSSLPFIELNIQRPGYVKAAPEHERLEKYICNATAYLQEKRLLPAAGYNFYDGLQAGILFKDMHETKRFNYYVAPLYGVKSARITGIAGGSMRINPGSTFEKITAGLSVAAFSIREGLNMAHEKVFGDVLKIVPSLNVALKTKNKKITNSFEYKFFYLQERELSYFMNPADSNYYPRTTSPAARYVNQLTFQHMNSRVLYPYSAQLQVQQGNSFFRINASGNYFFNYAHGGGLNIRVFAAKFGYLRSQSLSEKFLSRRYQPKLTAVNGDEDFTYSGYFIRRNDAHATGGQMMLRDGDLKLKTDLFEGLQGRSDNWVASANFSSTLPQITPIALPIRLFCDVGTYADAWNSESAGARFLYVAGIQFSIMKDLVNVNVPVIYSKEFRDRLKTVSDDSRFFGKLTFSVNLNRLQFSQPLCDQNF